MSTPTTAQSAPLHGGASGAVTVLGISPAPGTRTLPSLFRPQWRSMGVGVFWLVLTNLCALAVPRLINMGIDLVEGRPAHWPMLPTTQATVATVVVAILLLAVIGGGVRTASRVVLFNTGRDVEMALRRDLFDHLGTLSPAYFQRASIGDLMSRLTNDLTNIRLLSGFAFLNALNALIVVGVTIPVMLSLDVKVALLALAPLPVVMFASQFISKRMFKRTREQQEQVGKMSAVVQEALAGQSVVRGLSQEDAMAERFSTRNDAVYESSMRLARIRLFMGPMMGIMASMSVALALWAGGTAVVDGRMSIGDVVEINGRILQLTWPMIAMGFVLSVWQRGQASLVRINEVLAARPDIVDGVHVRPGATLRGEVRLEGLTLALGDPPRTVVDDVHLRIPAGSFQGIVGRNGSGKSLLLKAIARQLDVPRGTVFVDDVDGLDWALKALREAPGGIAVVPEDGFLFSASIRDNLAFARRDVSDAEIDRIIDLVDLRRDIARLPDGVETMVGERGVTLSGGQRQRVALGRAILARPSILILDDSLSAVDVETEQNIIAALRGGLTLDGDTPHQPTIIMVSHRLSVLRGATSIVGLADGRIVEQGTHESLIGGDGLYATLWGEQERRAALAARLKQGTTAEVSA